jgi:hypothetical protein
VLKSTKTQIKFSLPRKSRFLGSHSVVCRSSRVNWTSILIVWYTKLLIPLITLALVAPVTCTLLTCKLRYVSDCLMANEVPIAVLCFRKVKHCCRFSTGIHYGYCISEVQYNQQYATSSLSIYFYRLLYMFQAVTPAIIRSTKLYIQRQVLSNQYCCLLLSWMRWKLASISSTIAAGSSIGLKIRDAVCTVLCSWWWTEEPVWNMYREINR